MRHEKSRPTGNGAALTTAGQAVPSIVPPATDQPVIEAERFVIGTALTEIDHTPGADDLTPGEFLERRHEIAWRAISAARAAGEPVDLIAISERLSQAGDLQRAGGMPYLTDCAGAAMGPGTVAYYAGIIRAAAVRRRRRQLAERLTQLVDDDEVWEKRAPELLDRLSEKPTAEANRDGPAAAVELDDFLGVDDPEYDWVVPGLLERGDRVILTGGEGKGKSTLLRQLAVQLASGIHPFTGGPIVPVRVLLVDLENSQRQTRRKIRPLRVAAGDHYKPEPGLHIRVRPGGIDLLDGDDGRWLLDLAAGIRPDVLITGPIYKLAGGDPTEERTAKVVSMWLDRIRTDARCSLIIEAHSPYAAAGGKRPERPYGASLWSRWPEFGLYLAPEGHLRHWRGPRDEREWPAALQRGGEWPWMAITRDRDILWARIVELCREAGDQLSVRDLAKLTGKGTGTVQRAIEEHRNEWDSL